MAVHRVNAVFEGGGVKGIGFAGALLAMEEAGYRWVNTAGTSAGAIIASMIAAGYSAQEMKKIVEETDFKSFIDKTKIGSIPLVGPLISMIYSKGIYKGDAIEQWLKDKYKAKGIEKFGDLRTVSSDERFRYKLRVTACDIIQKRLLILPQDIERYGMNPDELDIARAVRMSITIPMFFTPVALKYNKRSKSLVVDGGLLSKYPVWLFDTQGELSRPTFGFRLVEPGTGKVHEDMSTIKYILNIVSTMLEAYDERYIEISNFKRSVMIPTVGVGTTEFDLSKKRITELYMSGYNAAKKFLGKWDYEEYLKEYGENPIQ